jgi:hypothetical protein
VNSALELPVHPEPPPDARGVGDLVASLAVGDIPVVVDAADVSVGSHAQRRRGVVEGAFGLDLGRVVVFLQRRGGVSRPCRVLLGLSLLLGLELQLCLFLGLEPCLLLGGAPAFFLCSLSFSFALGGQAGFLLEPLLLGDLALALDPCLLGGAALLLPASLLGPYFFLVLGAGDRLLVDQFLLRDPRLLLRQRVLALLRFSFEAGELFRLSRLPLDLLDPLRLATGGLGSLLLDDRDGGDDHRGDHEGGDDREDDAVTERGAAGSEAHDVGWRPTRPSSSSPAPSPACP